MTLRQLWDERIYPARVVTPSGCWEWPHGRFADGYGNIRMPGTRLQLRVHRISAALHLGLDIADSNTHALHRCDNPPCFNPEHLFLGTNAENVADSIAKGRHINPSPEQLERCVSGRHLMAETRKPRDTPGKAGYCIECTREYRRDWMKERRLHGGTPMTRTEARQIQTMLRYLFDDDEVVECRDARKATESARIVAQRSFQVLGTGLTRDDIPELGGCDGCTECERPIVTVPVGQLL